MLNIFPRSLPQLARVFLLLLSGGLLIWIMKAKNNQVSRNFNFIEFDSPEDKNVRGNITRLVFNVLQPLRDALNLPVIITSGYRNKEKNAAVNGAKNSNHLNGSAADFYVKGATLDDVFGTILNLKLPFDELILYRPGGRNKFGHIHISYKSPEDNRGRVFINESTYKR